MRPLVLSIELTVHAPELVEAIKSGVEILTSLNERVNKMSTSLDDLNAAVTANTSVIGSAIILINGIAGQIAAATTDPVALSSLVSSLQASSASLAAAVAANTPAATLVSSLSAARR